MILIIDPPATPYSDPGDIREWLAQLQQMRDQYSGDVDAIRDIDAATKEARAWLDTGRGVA